MEPNSCDICGVKIVDEESPVFVKYWGSFWKDFGGTGRSWTACKGCHERTLAILDAVQGLRNRRP